MRKRSKYRPKAVMLNPLASLRPAPEKAKNQVMLKFLSALQELMHGRHPGVDEWRSLSDAVNTVETLALHFGKLIPREVMPTVNRAIAGMVAASKRYTSGQGMRLDAEGLSALREIIGIYGDCLDGLTEREMAQAQAETQRRRNEALRNSSVAHTIVTM
jgi:hypothetical protein